MPKYEVLPLSKVWRPEVGQTEADAEEYDAINVKYAAELWSRNSHTRDPGGTWPIMLRVRDPDGKLWEVEVERIAVPEFHADKPRHVS